MLSTYHVPGKVLSTLQLTPVLEMGTLGRKATHGPQGAGSQPFGVTRKMKMSLFPTPMRRRAPAHSNPGRQEWVSFQGLQPLLQPPPQPQTQGQGPVTPVTAPPSPTRYLHHYTPEEEFTVLILK